MNKEKALELVVKEQTGNKVNAKPKIPLIEDLNELRIKHKMQLYMDLHLQLYLLSCLKF